MVGVIRIDPALQQAPSDPQRLPAKRLLQSIEVQCGGRLASDQVLYLA
jgi:hypothetical protein